MRVIAYVDGFNLYNGLRDKHGRKYLWLDLQALCTRLLKPGQSLEQVIYFTARVRNHPAGERRQTIYLSALATHCDRVTIVEGRFQQKQMRCHRCGAAWLTYEEKETDVSIATALVEDAAQDRYDLGLVLSANSDLCPAVRAVKRLDPAKRIVAAFPPRRRSDDLRRTAHAAFTIGDANIRKSLLPPQVTGHGVPFKRPSKWH